MQKIILAVFSASLCMSYACGGTADKLQPIEVAGGKSDDDTGSIQSTVAKGNLIDAQLQPGDLIDCGNGGSIQLDYIDIANFFNRASKINASVKATYTSGDTSTSTVSLASSGDTTDVDYFLIACLKSGEVSSVVLSFTDPATGKADSNHDKGYTAHFAAPKADPTASFTSIDGNQVSVDISLMPSSSENCGGAALELTYVDSHHVFGGASTILMWHQIDNQPHGFASLSPLKGPNGSYHTSRFCLSSSSVKTIKMAFTNNAQTIWDSNNSQNYTVTFH